MYLNYFSTTRFDAQNINSNELVELVERADAIFKDTSIPEEKKDKVYQSLMKLYLTMKEGAQLDRFYDLYGAGKLSKARLTQKTENLEKVLANVRMELDQLKKLNGAEVDLQAVRAFLLKHKANMQDANEETKKALIDAFVHKIVIESDKVTLTLKIDEELDEGLTISNSDVDMCRIAVTIKHIYTTVVQASFDEAPKKRYTPYDADYHKYDAKRREYRKARKKKLSPRK